MKIRPHKETAAQTRIEASAFTSALYLATVRILYSLCRQVWFQNIQRKEERYHRLVDRFLAEIKYPAEMWGDFRTRGLQATLAGNIWGRHLISAAPVVVEGGDYLQQARASSRGVILARFHQKLAKIDSASPLAAWIAREQRDSGFIVGARRNTSHDTAENILNARDLVDARRILKRGGIVQIVPDGYVGQQGVAVNFFGRMRNFRKGFAELAVLTQAPVLPIHLLFKTDGTIVIKIHPALRVPQGLSHEKQIENLIQQYAAVLGRFWTSNPHMIIRHHIKKHMGVELDPGEDPD